MSLQSKMNQIKNNKLAQQENLHKLENYKQKIGEFAEQVLKANKIVSAYRQKTIDKELSFDIFSLKSTVAQKYLSGLEDTIKEMCDDVNEKKESIYINHPYSSRIVSYMGDQNFPDSNNLKKAIINEAFNNYIEALQDILKLENKEDTLLMLKNNIPSEHQKFLEFFISIKNISPKSEITFNRAILSDYSSLFNNDDATILYDEFKILHSLNISQTYQDILKMDNREDKSIKIDATKSDIFKSLFSSFYDTLSKHFTGTASNDKQENPAKPQEKSMFQYIIDKLIPSDKNANKQEIEKDQKSTQKQVESYESKHQFPEGFSTKASDDSYKVALDTSVQAYLQQIAKFGKISCYTEVVNANQALTNCQSQHVTSENGFTETCNPHAYKLEYLEQMCNTLYPFTLDDNTENTIIEYYQNSSEIRVNKDGDLATLTAHGISGSSFAQVSYDVNAREMLDNADGSQQLLLPASTSEEPDLLGLPANEADGL